MIKLNEHVNLLIKNKINIQQYSADDEKNIRDILNKIISAHQFHAQYKEYCWTWLDEIVKPSRRFQKLKPENFDLSREKKARIEKREKAK